MTFDRTSTCPLKKGTRQLCMAVRSLLPMDFASRKMAGDATGRVPRVRRPIFGGTRIRRGVCTTHIHARNRSERDHRQVCWVRRDRGSNTSSFLQTGRRVHTGYGDGGYTQHTDGRRVTPRIGIVETCAMGCSLRCPHTHAKRLPLPFPPSGSQRV